MALPATDGFSQTSGSTQALTTYSANWTIIGSGDFEVPSGANRVEGTSGSYNTAYWNADTFAADHYSQMAFTTSQVTEGVYGGPAVRCQTGADTSYHVDCNGSATYLSGDNAGSHFLSQDISGDVGTVNNGDVLKLTVEGTGATVTLKVYTAAAASPTVFTLKSTYNDTSGDRITTAGHAGIFVYGNSNGGPTNFKADNLGGGGGTPLKRNSTLNGLGASGPFFHNPLG
jgi:hypothetical protein